MKKTLLRLAVTALAVVSSVTAILLSLQIKGHSNQPESFILNSPQDCTQSKDAEAAQEEAKTEQALENVPATTNAAPSQNELLDDTQIAAIPDEALKMMERITQSRDDLVKGEVEIAEQIQNEVILESVAAEVQTMTPEGVVSCDVTDNFIDSIVEPEDRLIFIGGSQDNQEAE